MPKIRLELTVTWDEIDVTFLQKRVGDVSNDVSQLSGFDIAEKLESGNLPYPWKDKLATLTEEKPTIEIKAIPADGQERAHYYIERDRGKSNEGLDAWLEHTHPAWVASERAHYPGAQGFPSVGAREPRHLSFSAKELMSSMTSADIHDVLYSDDYHLDYWDWKQKLLYQLQPTSMGLGIR